MVAAGFVWQWFVHSVGTESAKVPPSITNTTSGPNSPIIENNKGVVEIGGSAAEPQPPKNELEKKGERRAEE